MDSEKSLIPKIRIRTEPMLVFLVEVEETGEPIGYALTEENARKIYTFATGKEYDKHPMATLIFPCN